jgi:thioester reductase-like protein/NAD(P)-dependent dehydrogenase (short-subunit alcohol dehydrogenase family)
MTRYLVTGGTGFLGRRLITRLLTRPDCDGLYVLVRPRSLDRFASLTQEWDTSRVVAVPGDLTEPGLGITDLPGPVDHVVHLGAVYDFTAAEDVNRAVNVTGTRNVIAFAGQVGAQCLHHISSVAVAGTYRGRFTEADFDLGQDLPSPYHATKFEAEKLVRTQEVVPWRVYRPAAVVGDSQTGEMDKADGPYYFLPAITRLSRLPARLPLVVPWLGSTNIVPVDYVVDAIAHLMHAPVPGTTFHLGAPRNQTLTEVYNAFAGPAGAPKIVASPRLPGVVRSGRAAGRLAGNVVDRLPGGREARNAVLTELGIPPEVVPHMVMEPEFDTAATQDALAGSGISVPPLAAYAPRLLRYWSEHLDPYRARRRMDRADPLAGRRIMVTGASSGIGRATALAVARRGAQVLLVARREEELASVRSEIVAAGGSAWVYPCDLTDGPAVEALVKQVLAEHEAVDMLVNNAGRSIRRSVFLSVDRLHDYERTMALNYFAPLRLTLGLLPHMRERRFGARGDCDHNGPAERHTEVLRLPGFESGDRGVRPRRRARTAGGRHHVHVRTHAPGAYTHDRGRERLPRHAGHERLAGRRDGGQGPREPARGREQAGGRRPGAGPDRRAPDHAPGREPGVPHDGRNRARGPQPPAASPRLGRRDPHPAGVAQTLRFPPAWNQDTIRAARRQVTGPGTTSG